MIKEKLKEIRERTGMNKKEFASFIGIKYTTYNNYETGEREPGSDFLILISQKFDVSIDYILGLQGEKEIKHSYELKAYEYDHIKKYRALDPHGKKMVDFTLQEEWERVTAEAPKVDKVVPMAVREDTNYVNAAHADDYANAPEELKQLEEDIMDDENF